MFYSFLRALVCAESVISISGTVNKSSTTKKDSLRVIRLENEDLRFGAEVLKDKVETLNAVVKSLQIQLDAKHTELTEYAERYNDLRRENQHIEHVASERLKQWRQCVAQLEWIYTDQSQQQLEQPLHAVHQESQPEAIPQPDGPWFPGVYEMHSDPSHWSALPYYPEYPTIPETMHENHGFSDSAPIVLPIPDVDAPAAIAAVVNVQDVNVQGVDVSDVNVQDMDVSVAVDPTPDIMFSQESHPPPPPPPPPGVNGQQSDRNQRRRSRGGKQNEHRTTEGDNAKRYRLGRRGVRDETEVAVPQTCDLCQIQVNSVTQLRTHMLGRKHQEMVRNALMMKGNAIHPMAEDV